MKILLINGPNLNLIGLRESHWYGRETLEEVVGRLRSRMKKGDDLVPVQANGEGVLVDAIQQQGREADWILINAGAYTHTSIAIRDALLAVDRPFIEIHISNIYAREKFRKKSVLADKAIGVVTGFGTFSYDMALLYAMQRGERSGQRL